MSAPNLIISNGVYIFTNLESATWNKLDDFANFQNGWNYGEGKSFEFNVLSYAKSILSHLLFVGFRITDTFPGLDGEIRITAYYNEYYLELTINESLYIDFNLEENDALIDEKQNLSLINTIGLITKVWNDRCKSLESSMLSNFMISKEDVFSPLPLKVLRESQFLKRIVPSVNLEEFAVTFQSSIPELLEIR